MFDIAARERWAHPGLTVDNQSLQPWCFGGPTATAPFTSLASRKIPAGCGRLWRRLVSIVVPGVVPGRET